MAFPGENWEVSDDLGYEGLRRDRAAYPAGVQMPSITGCIMLGFQRAVEEAPAHHVHICQEYLLDDSGNCGGDL